MTTFVAISDTHNRHSELTIPDADLIIHAGDSTGRGTTREITEFCEWYGSLPHQHKILIAGNHDWGFQENPEVCQRICKDNGIIYLQDSNVTINGIKIHGSPQSPEFCDWAFNCWRTQKMKDLDVHGHDYEFIGKFWDMIPADTDILITHGPPYEILDRCAGGNVGCEELLKAVKRVNPDFHIFGHIHEGSGNKEIGETNFINASSLDGRYEPYPWDIKVYDFENQQTIRED